jgi:hypothetical protein
MIEMTDQNEDFWNKVIAVLALIMLALELFSWWIK